MKFNYEFPAVKGIQANREYFITMVPLKLLSKLFPSDESIVLPEFRAQRRINEARIPEIKRYILDNRDSYVFSALSASIDGEYEFRSIADEDTGILLVNMDSIFLINDGQHRKAAIEAAMQEDASLENETISIVFFKDVGLERSQQMFTDLNKHAVRTSNSLSTLYDSRDILAVITKDIIENIPFFKMYTDKERDILGKNSSKLFTLNNIYKANEKIVHKEHCGEAERIFLKKYWTAVSENILEWQEVMNKSLTKKALRENYIVTLAITLNAFGKLGRYFWENQEIDMEKCLKGLRKIDWFRSSDNWDGRAIRNGKVQSSDIATVLTCSKIKQLLGIQLTQDERYREERLK